MIPVTQKKVIKPPMNINISHCPIWARVRWLFVNTILIIRKTVKRISWKSCKPEILSISLIFLNPEKKVPKVLPETMASGTKLCRNVLKVKNRPKDSN